MKKINEKIKLERASFSLGLSSVLYAIFFTLIIIYRYVQPRSFVAMMTIWFGFMITILFILPSIFIIISTLGLIFGIKRLKIEKTKLAIWGVILSSVSIVLIIALNIVIFLPDLI